jgi:hypothetical protein
VSAQELTAYADAVERRLSIHRGREHVLTPPDFALVRDWQRAGIPLARVLAAIDDAARGGDALTSLATLRHLLAQQRPRV